jgi:hypothetical protein
VKIALNSCASANSDTNFFGGTMSQSDNISSQKTVSSASSTTIANLCDPFRLRSSPAGCSVIRRDRCSRSHQLLTQHLRVGLERQRPKTRTILTANFFVRSRSSSCCNGIRFSNYKITRLPNYKIKPASARPPSQTDKPSHLNALQILFEIFSRRPWSA